MPCTRSFGTSVIDCVVCGRVRLTSWLVIRPSQIGLLMIISLKKITVKTTPSMRPRLAVPEQNAISASLTRTYTFGVVSISSGNVPPRLSNGGTLPSALGCLGEVMTSAGYIRLAKFV